MSFLTLDLNLLRVFDAVMTEQNLTRAAGHLAMTQPAVSHALKRLHETVGETLFERSAHGVRLTAAGERYLSRVAGALQAIASASDDLRQGVANSLYVHCSPSLAQLWLMPRLGAFWNAHQDIIIDHMISDRVQDLRRTDVDLRIRYGDGVWPEEEAMKLFDDRVVVDFQFDDSMRLEQPVHAGVLRRAVQCC